jgi:hypothetical protein
MNNGRHRGRLDHGDASGSRGQVELPIHPFLNRAFLQNLQDAPFPLKRTPHRQVWRQPFRAFPFLLAQLFDFSFECLQFGFQRHYLDFEPGNGTIDTFIDLLDQLPDE